MVPILAFTRLLGAFLLNANDETVVKVDGPDQTNHALARQPNPVPQVVRGALEVQGSVRVPQNLPDRLITAPRELGPFESSQCCPTKHRQ
eukprot:CAMPEP_0174852838 /NCGR_PEP_ID=MMETSP1114-20130205/26956_1 /TAXON_ID=312471 /ORGANISM="Neobodo designis, Strain CCAP 1951/1" /LENGTH=89 /DNA_ID=CAMNT_0016087455 /DNA_START=193 /DNA_END=462 /DNA_ORIENTATION=+